VCVREREREREEEGLGVDLTCNSVACLKSKEKECFILFLHLVSLVFSIALVVLNPINISVS